MIRITGGRLRGRQIASPRGKDKPSAASVRPTTALVRESVFSQLQTHLPGARFLDLFAGSGIMGLEATSRGAGFVLAVDRDRRQCQAINHAAETFGLREDEYKIIAFDVTRLLAQANREAPFDIVFLDPPYGFDAWESVLGKLQANGWLTEAGIIVAEHGSRELETLQAQGFKRRAYGDTTLSVRLPGSD